MGNSATNPMVGNANWQALGVGGFYGSPIAVGGGGNMARDHLDAQRMGVAQIPSAQYPDGYVNTLNSRRDDRLLDTVKANNRSYTRGVHKGERIDSSDYLWPDALQPNRGLINEAQGRKTAPMLSLAPHPHLVNSGKAETPPPSPSDVPAVLDPNRRAQMGRLVPVWT